MEQIDARDSYGKRWHKVLQRKDELKLKRIEFIADVIDVFIIGYTIITIHNMANFFLE